MNCKKGCAQCLEDLACISCLSIERISLQEQECVCAAKMQLDPQNKQCIEVLQVVNIGIEQLDNMTLCIKLKFNKDLLNSSQIAIGRDIALNFSSLSPSDYYIVLQTAETAGNSAGGDSSSEKPTSDSLFVYVYLQKQFTQETLSIQIPEGNQFQGSQGQEIQILNNVSQSYQMDLAPFLQDQSSAKLSKSLEKAAEDLLSSDEGQPINVFKRFSFILYFVNSIQLTSSLILLNVTWPQHTYATLRLISASVFMNIPEWGQNPAYQEPSFVFGLDLPHSFTIASEPQQTNFRRVS